MFIFKQPDTYQYVFGWIKKYVNHGYGKNNLEGNEMQGLFESGKFRGDNKDEIKEYDEKALMAKTVFWDNYIMTAYQQHYAVI